MRITHLTALTLSLFSLTAHAQELAVEAPAPKAPTRGPVEVEGRVIVRFNEDTSLESARRKLAEPRWYVTKELVGKLDMFLVEILDGKTVSEARLELETMETVMYASPDHIVSSRQTTPNDSSFGSQWALNQSNDADIDAVEAWDFGTGSRDYVCAVVDGGCQVNHSDLAANIWVNQAEASGSSGVDDDGNGYVDDVNGWNAFNNNGNVGSSDHGTHVSGTVGAVGNNGIGVSGVSWEVGVMPIAGSSGSTSTVLIAYNYALAQKDIWLASGGSAGACVVSTNSSFGIDQANCNSGTYQPWNNMYTLMGESGILSCAATANANWNIDSVGDVPTGCNSDFMVAVTNTTSSDAKASSAGYGVVSIDLGAPGTGILSTVPNNSYASYSGTSMATPHVAGAIPYLFSVASPAFLAHHAANPGDAAQEMKRMILENVDILPTLSSVTVSGGRLNLFKAAEEARVWPGGPTILFSYPNGRPEVLSPSGDSVQVLLTETQPGTLDGSSPTLHYNDGSGWIASALAPSSSNNWLALFGATSCASTVEWYVSADTTDGNSWRDPVSSNHSSLSAEGTPTIASDDMETAAGWTGGVAGDNATTGVWVRVDPIATAAQSGNDHSPSGTQCWVTGQGTNGGSLGENDVDGGSTTLLSATYDLSGATNPTISYWRWYSNDSGASPGADSFSVDISNNNGSTWTHVEVVGPTGSGTSGGWIQHSFLVSDLVSPTAQVKLRFIASDLGSGSIIEAAIDDLAIQDLDCGNCGAQSYCSTSPNPTGGGALMGYSGSTSHSANDLVLTAANAQPNQFGVFFYGQNTANAPFGDGIRCVGAPVTRLPVVQADAFGDASYALDVTSGSSTQISPNSTWNFQFWYRTPSSAATFNLSDGLSVSFCQ